MKARPTGHRTEARNEPHLAGEVFEAEGDGAAQREGVSCGHDDVEVYESGENAVGIGAVHRIEELQQAVPPARGDLAHHAKVHKYQAPCSQQ